MSDTTKLIECIKERCAGRTRWYVMNAAEDGYCIDFGRKQEADEWMSRYMRESPDYIERNGYHIVEQQSLTDADVLANEAAALIKQQAARIAALESAAKAEPVGWAWKPRGGRLDFSDAQDRPTGADLQFAKDNGGEFVPLYTAPAATDNGGGRDAWLQTLYEVLMQQNIETSSESYLSLKCVGVPPTEDEFAKAVRRAIDAALSQKAGEQG